MKTRRMILLLVLTFAASMMTGCDMPGSDSAVVIEFDVATATTDADGQAAIALHPGETYEVHLEADETTSDVEDVDVALAEVGDNLWLQITDREGRYFPATTVLQAPVNTDNPIGVWLTPVDDADVTVRRVLFSPVVPFGSRIGQMSPAVFAEDILDEIEEDDFATFVIELTRAGALPETTDIYPLPFENTTLLLTGSEALGVAGANHVIAAVSGEVLQEGGDALILGIEAALDDLDTATIPGWLVGSDHIWADTRLQWTYAGDYEFEGIACDTAGTAIEQVLAYLDLRGEILTQTSLADFTLAEPGQIVIASPAQGDSWYAGGEGETLTLWYCESVTETMVEEPVEESPGEEVAEEAIEETEEAEETEEVYATNEAIGEATITTESSNVRTGPGVAYPILVTLETDTTVSVFGKNEAETWVQVASTEAEERGWVNANLLAFGDLEMDALPTISDIPAPPITAAGTSVDCVRPRIELWAAELAPDHADHVWQLVYRASGATELRVFDNVMSNPVAGTFPIYGNDDANWVLTASHSPGCYTERNLNVVVDELPPSGTYSNATHGFPQLGIGDVQVTLHWSGEADLDLHVIDPFGEEIYSGHMFSSSGGMLDGDANWPCGPGPAPVENVFWPEGGAPGGEYRVLVEYHEDCKNQGVVDWTVMVRVDGNVVASQTGQISEGQTAHALTFYK